VGGKKPLLETQRARVGEGNITNETTRVKPLLCYGKIVVGNLLFIYYS